MSSDAIMINDILENLDEEDYRIAITFLQYLSDMKKKTRQRKVTRYFLRYRDCFQITKGGTVRNKCWQIWLHSERSVWAYENYAGYECPDISVCLWRTDRTAHEGSF